MRRLNDFRLASHSNWLGLAIVLPVVFCPSVVFAEIYKCHYTEPFFRAVYDTRLKKLTIYDDVESLRKIMSGINLRKTQNGKIDLQNREGMIVQRIDLTSRGSDGMSDKVYPYKGEWSASKLEGGCEIER